jgi:hypothetical protein
VRYNNTSNAPSVLTRTVTYKVNDGTTDSNPDPRHHRGPVNSAPVVTTSAGTTTANLRRPPGHRQHDHSHGRRQPQPASATITIMNPSTDGALEVLGPSGAICALPGGLHLHPGSTR